MASEVALAVTGSLIATAVITLGAWLLAGKHEWRAPLVAPTANERLRCGVYGLLAHLGVFALMLGFAAIGLAPLTLLLGAAWAGVSFLGTVVGWLAVAALVWRSRAPPADRRAGPAATTLAVYVGVLVFIALLVPILGTLVLAAVNILGVGALVLHVRGR